MSFMDLRVVAVLIGIPVAVIGLVYLATYLIKRRRETAFWNSITTIPNWHNYTTTTSTEGMPEYEYEIEPMIGMGDLGPEEPNVKESPKKPIKRTNKKSAKKPSKKSTPSKATALKKRKNSK